MTRSNSRAVRGIGSAQLADERRVDSLQVGTEPFLIRVEGEIEFRDSRLQIGERFREGAAVPKLVDLLRFQNELASLGRLSDGDRLDDAQRSSFS